MPSALDTEDPDRADGAELRMFRATAVLAATVYPAWGILCDLLLPGSINLHLQRLAVAALFAASALATFVVPVLARHPRGLLLTCCCALVVHYAHLLRVNDFAPFYLVGIFITLGALDVLIGDAKSFVAFSVCVVAISIGLVIAAGAPGFWGPLMLAGVITQQGLFGVSLAWRTGLTRRLTLATHTISEQNQQLLTLVRTREDFLRLVSHELRSPLTVISGCGELLEGSLDGRLGREQQEYLQGLHAGCQQLTSLVEELVDFARVDTPSFRVVKAQESLSDLVREVVEGFAPSAQGKGVYLVHEVPQSRLMVAMDRGRIAQVLSNLVANAIKFTPQGGHVTVVAAAGEGCARIEVRDTGRGIPEEARAKLFDRFYQVTAADSSELGGLGLGLSIARSLVESHGGRIGVESSTEAGSIFWFLLPTS